MNHQRTLCIASLTTTLLLAFSGLAVADGMTVQGQTVSESTPSIDTPGVASQTQTYGPVATPAVASQPYSTPALGAGPLCTVNACTTPVTTPDVHTQDTTLGTCPNTCLVVHSIEVLPSQNLGSVCSNAAQACVGTGTLVPAQNGQTPGVGSVQLLPGGSVTTPGVQSVHVADPATVEAGYGDTTVVPPSVVMHQLPPVDIVFGPIEFHDHDTPSVPQTEGGSASSSITIGFSAAGQDKSVTVPLVLP